MSACRECATRGLLLKFLAGHIDRAVDHRVGSRARELLALSDEELAAAVAPTDPGKWLRKVRSAEAHRALDRALAASGCWSACPHDGNAPRSLSEALGSAAPRALFGAGSVEALATIAPERSVTVVGARRAGAYGREVAHELSRLLAGSGVVLISGLALGIDSAAHEGALAGSGSTIAILGTGPERPYPRSRRNLYERIRAGGLVISELPPGSPTFRWMFPARNRLMAALSGITVVVEAAERSGSLITAEMAAEMGRQVAAVPGPVTSWRSSGTNKLLADGAAVVRHAQDVLDLLLGPGAERVREIGPAVDEPGRAILAAVEGGAGSADSVSSSAAIGYGAALAALGRLEREGYVRSDVTGRYTRTVLSPPDLA